MSTEYGRIRDKNGQIVCVEVYGTTYTVKLQREDGTPIIAIDDEAALGQLVVALELAREHCWPSE